MRSPTKRPTLRRNWIALCLLLLTPVGCVLGGRYLMYGRFTLPGLEEMIAPGLPVAEAMCAYRIERGLWPQYLEDLVPEHLSALPADSETHRWHYSWNPWAARFDGWFPRNPRTEVSFQASRGEEPAWYWSATGEGPDPYVRLDLPLLDASRVGVDDAVLLTWRLKELRRRIKREPAKRDHRQGLVSHLVAAEHLAEAHEACLEYAGALPADWWPKVMLALIDTRREACDCGEKRLLRWVEESEAFMPSYYLASYHRVNGEFEAALEALRRAVELPFRTGPGDERADWYYVLDIACLAHRHDAHELVLAICGQWEGLREEYGDEGSWLAVRAATRLALGEPDRAAGDLQLLEVHEESHSLWAKNVDDLRRAVESRDSGFRYEPRGPRLELDDLLIGYW